MTEKMTWSEAIQALNQNSDIKFNEGFWQMREAAQAQPQQEPVAWMNAKRDMTYLHGPYNADDIPLYTQPPAQRKPLTLHEIVRLTQGLDLNGISWVDVIRAVETAHGIKE